MTSTKMTTRFLLSINLVSRSTAGPSCITIGRACTRPVFQVRSVTTSSPQKDTSHFKQSSVKHPLADKLGYKQRNDYLLPHPIWSEDEVENVKITHHKPGDFVDKMAYYTVNSLRACFDWFSGYKLGMYFNTLNEEKWLRRIIFLETVAGVPGMVAAMTRHLRSLRDMQRDYGWIHTLLEEAENERMHLMTMLELKNPTIMFKGSVVLFQGLYVSAFWLAYLVSPRFCHRFVGYLEEEAVKTYTHCLETFEDGTLKHWPVMPATDMAKRYWKLPEDAKMKDVILAIRADEAHHREVNHTFSSMKQDQINPYGPGR